MKKSITMTTALALAGMAGGGLVSAETRIPVYNYVTFYDGYNVIPADAPDEDGCTMIHSYLKTKKLSDEILDQLGEHLTLEVDIHARCDNYDRIGSVNLAFLPKGTESYTVTQNPEVDPTRIEIARYITPFMDKNREPSTVTYSYYIDNVSAILRDPAVRAEYDIWIEFELFGVPYAANTQILGCAGCVDVFGGTLTFITDEEAAGAADTNVFVPITIRDGRPDRGLNNYNEEGTDEIGKCIKTYNFTVPKEVKSGRVVVVMSNHGANSGGEEYNRRKHRLYFDDDTKLAWIPGRPSCEPFREYNTQLNGIYGDTPMSDAAWQSFSNWCPGAPIPFQTFELADVSAGEHALTVKVTGTKFPNKQGYFPFSAYFQGDTEGKAIAAPIDYDTLAESGIEGIMSETGNGGTLKVRVEDIRLRVSTQEAMQEAALYDLGGRKLQSCKCNGSTEALLDISCYVSGAYIVKVSTDKGISSTKVAW